MAENSNKYILFPAYDMLSTNVAIPSDKEELALTVNGKKQNIQRKGFIKFVQIFGIAEKTADKMIEKIVKLKESYYLKSDIEDSETVKSFVDALAVKTVSTEINDESIAFSTKKIYTSSKNKGYSEVTTVGKNGLTRKTVVTEKINGEISSQTQVSEEVVSNPVQEVITIGTGRNTSKKVSSGFVFPVNGKYQVSAYYGDGRNHKGIDLRANKGVPICAVASGTVTYSGYDGTFGYTVVIDHGNGTQTRYAHAEALCVKKGAVVSQGELIATVGRSGNATGNHLHFEVIVNGVRVNPAPYIGL